MNTVLSFSNHHFCLYSTFHFGLVSAANNNHIRILNRAALSHRSTAGDCLCQVHSHMFGSGVTSAVCAGSEGFITSVVWFSIYATFICF